MTVYPNMAKQFPFKDICLYMCHCFQHYLVINFEVIDLNIKKGSSIFAFYQFLNKSLKHLTYI